MMSALFPWLLALWVKGSILLILALVADRVLRRAPAHTRHAMWTGTFVALLALPILSGLLPALPVPGLNLPLAAFVEATAGEPASPVADRPGTGGVAATARTADADSAAGIEPGGMTSQSHVIPATPPNGYFSGSTVRDYGAVLVARLIESAPANVIGVWAAGALAALILLLISFRRAWRLVARAGELLDTAWRADLRKARALLGMRESVRLRASSQIGTPMAGGLLRRVVLVPAQARTWSAERRRFVLLHELVHLARRDPARHLVARLALVLHWPNPLAWLAAHRAMAAREEACDEQVLALGAKPSSYARELLELNEILRSPTTACIAALPMIQRSRMEKRVMNILRENRRPLRRPAAIALVAVASIAALSVAAAAPQEPKRVVKVERVVDVSVVRQVEVKIAPVVEVKVVPDVVATQPITMIAGRGPESACSWDGRGNFMGRMTSRRSDDGEYTIFEQAGMQDGDSVFVKRYDDKTLCMRTDGDVEIDRETGRVARIGSDGVVVWEAHDGDTVQRLEVRSGDDYTWSVEGEERPFDAEAQAWYDGMREVMAAQWQIWSLRGEVASKRGEIASVRGEHASLRGEMAAARGQVASMRGQIASAHGEGASMQGRIASIRGEAAGLRGQVASERGTIASLNARRMDADEQERAEIDHQIQEHKASIEQLERQIEIFAMETRVEEVERERESADLEKQVAKIEAQIADYDLQGRIAEFELQAEALEVETNVERLHAEIEAMNATERVEELEATLATALERLERLIEKTR